jgi:hypothetical protein
VRSKSRGTATSRPFWPKTSLLKSPRVMSQWQACISHHYRTIRKVRAAGPRSDRSTKRSTYGCGSRRRTVGFHWQTRYDRSKLLVTSQSGSVTALRHEPREVDLGDRFTRSVTWSIVVHSDARPRTMGSKRLLISVPNATKDITAALNALLADAFFIKTRNIRWSVSGQRFRDYHLLFEK